MKAKDIMTRDVITVRSTTTVEEIARLLTLHRIGGVPVVDDESHVVGIVTERDLFLKENGIPFSAVKLPQLFKQWVKPGKLAEIYAGARHHKASDVMTQNPIYVNSEEDIGHVAWKMVRYDIKRVPVIDNGVLVGIITRADIVGLLAGDQGCVDDESQGHERYAAGM
jgi:CBS domain-containing protein